MAWPGISNSSDSRSRTMPWIWVEEVRVRWRRPRSYSATYARGRAHRLDHAVEIVRGQHRDHARQRAGGGDVDADDAGMGVVAAAERGVQGTGGDAIVGKRALTGQQARILDALDAGADRL